MKINTIQNRLSKSEKQKVIFLIGILFLLFILVIYHSLFYSNIKKSGHIFIPHNSSFNDVTQKLKPYLINQTTFNFVAKLKKYKKNIKYEVIKGEGNADLVNKLRSGNQIPVTILFNNQNSIDLLVNSIAKQIEPTANALKKAMLDSLFLKKNNLTPDNAISIYIPNSYEFYWNTSATNFRDKMLLAYKQFWRKNNRLQKAKKLKLNPVQIIILASIIQKETAKIDERPIVAGLYLNRLKKGWPLQADPTVIYALKQIYKKDTVIKRVLNKDLLISSPYNTYLYKGLPPGPIAMPDVSSIDAVLNPVKHNYMYMCASTTKLGYHEFAKTAYQHAINASKYQRWINRQGIKR